LANFHVLNHIDFIENYLVYVSTNELGTDQLLVKIGVENPSEELEKEIKDKFRAKLRVAPEIEFEEIESIRKIQSPEINRKPIKFFDLRSKSE
jgi:phenylacetate-CoA ligase